MYHVNLQLVSRRIEALEVVRHGYGRVSSRDHTEIHQITHSVDTLDAQGGEATCKLRDTRTMYLLEDDDAKAFPEHTFCEIRYIWCLGGLHRLEENVRLKVRCAEKREHVERRNTSTWDGMCGVRQQNEADLHRAHGRVRLT